MSAESMLAGLYPKGPLILSEKLQDLASPPFNISNLAKVKQELGSNALPNAFQPVEIQTINLNFDNLLYGFGTDQCPRFIQINQDIQNSEDYKQRVHKYVETIQPQVLQIFGANYSYEDAAYIGDTLVCEKFHDFPLPNGVTQEIYDELNSMYNYTNSYFFTPEGAALSSSEFFNAVINQFNNTIYNSSLLKIGLYSGHDTSIIGFLIFMGLWDGLNPPFASTLVFELYLENGDYFLKMIYNDKPLILEGCQLMCPYEIFLEIIQPKIVSNLQEACKIKNQIIDYNSETLIKSLTERALKILNYN